MTKLRTTNLTFSAIFVCLMAIGANITVWFPMLAIPIGGATVPLSLQTFFATIAGLMLGKRLGAFAMMTYILIGIAGLPVFSQLKAGPMQLFLPTGGFIISFIFVAFFAGLIAERCKKPSYPMYILAAFTGLIFNYGIGVTYMYVAINTWLELQISYTLAWSGMIPFLIKDTGLACLAAVFMLNLVKRIPSRWISTVKAS
ncbi:biotin transporter BioY [Lentibacillus sp. CBA3610]|uniref:biotin transporter BioY n=1 Tax=Lentibacillus sp. CBA3610 TaxID=2518176 RepID=UPI0015958CC7|nr:biotin transporter BioY [Lentibacillus sp. CBA3610]QKY69779.1 biotin transporter BioY [Lentibacillus sp. CBA3610]